MMKVVLKGPKSCQLDLGNGFRQSGIPHELTTSELKKAEKDDRIEYYIDGEDVFYERKKPKAKYTKESLEGKSFAQLKDIGKKFGVTDRKKSTLIKEILGAQK